MVQVLVYPSLHMISMVTMVRGTTLPSSMGAPLTNNASLKVVVLLLTSQLVHSEDHLDSPQHIGVELHGSHYSQSTSSSCDRLDSADHRDHVRLQVPDSDRNVMQLLVHTGKTSRGTNRLSSGMFDQQQHTHAMDHLKAGVAFCIVEKVWD